MSTSERKVPFFKYQRAFHNQESQFVEIFQDIIRRGAFILQRDLADFEQALASYLGVKHAFGVGNATDGMIIAWRAIGLCQGDEVIFPSHTMVATPAAIHFGGGIPVPVDCGSDHLIDPTQIENAITDRTRAIAPVQLNGRTCNMDPILELADRHQLIIMEDAAQALGSRFKQRPAGTFGQAGVFSFYPAKVLGCLGDGGAVVTNDDELARKIGRLRDHGRDESGEICMWGMNSRLDNLQAAFLHAQLKGYREVVEFRRTLALRYQTNLASCGHLALPPAPESDADHFDVYQNYEIEANYRDELKTHLQSRGIGTLIQWGGKPVHQHEKLGFRVELPATDRLFARCLLLPMNICLGNDDIDYVSESILEFYRQR